MKINKLIFSLFIFFAIIICSNICFGADLDVINQYFITVDPNTNGTLDLTYHLEWKVLDSTTEGPLEWVKIGIPNANVSNIKAISNNIDKIYYYKDKGDFIRIDFKKSYQAGEVLDIDFKFTQSHMYTKYTESCTYTYTPGWFNDINVKKMVIKWNTQKVTSFSPKAKVSDGYYVYTVNNMLKGKFCTVNVSYPSNAFNTSYEMQASHATKTKSTNNFFSAEPIYITIAIISVFTVGFCATIFSGSGYSSHRGWGYDDDDDDDWHSSSSSCVSSCACACACAGGGRAGCSKKDLYGTNLRTQKLNKILAK